MWVTKCRSPHEVRATLFTLLLRAGFCYNQSTFLVLKLVHAKNDLIK